MIQGSVEVFTCYIHVFFLVLYEYVYWDARLDLAIHHPNNTQTKKPRTQNSGKCVQCFIRDRQTTEQAEEGGSFSVNSLVMVPCSVYVTLACCWTNLTPWVFCPHRWLLQNSHAALLCLFALARQSDFQPVYICLSVLLSLPPSLHLSACSSVCRFV